MDEASGTGRHKRMSCQHIHNRSRGRGSASAPRTPRRPAASSTSLIHRPLLCVRACVPRYECATAPAQRSRRRTMNTGIFKCSSVLKTSVWRGRVRTRSGRCATTAKGRDGRHLPSPCVLPPRIIARCRNSDNLVPAMPEQRAFR